MKVNNKAKSVKKTGKSSDQERDEIVFFGLLAFLIGGGMKVVRMSKQHGNAIDCYRKMNMDVGRGSFK